MNSKISILEKYLQKKEQIEKAEEEFKTIKKQLALEMNKIKFEDKSKTFGKYTVKKIIRSKICWDADKIERTKAKKALTKKYIVKDSARLTRFLKEHNISKKEFLENFLIEKEVNTDVLDQMFETNEIQLTDVVDCYTVKKISEYYTVKQEKEK